MIKTNKKIIYIITPIVFILDYISKILVCNYIDYTSSIKVINNIFYLTYVKNEGVAFSMLSGDIPIILILTILLVVGITGYLIKTKNISNKDILGFAMILGGALGNLFDRVVYGYVIDFIHIYVCGYSYPIFNLADSFIVIGAVILLFKNKK